jgi:hypothetical protein
LVYRKMESLEVLDEVLSDINAAKVRLSLAEAKMSRSGLTGKPGHEEIAQFICAALRYANVATDAATRRQRLEKQ